MSFVKKAAKKVFKPIKKVVKKVWKPVLIGASIFFTAGLATVGFAGLAAATSAGGLLSGIGTTMLAGGQAMLGAVGLGSGLSASVASATGATAGTNLFSGALATGIKSGLAKFGLGTAPTGVFGGQAPLASFGAEAGISTKSLAGLGGSFVGGTSAPLASTAGTGFFGKVGSFLGGLTKTSAGQMMLFNGISQGVQAYAADKQSKKERDRQRRLNFYGGPMMGGSSELPEGLIFPNFDPYSEGNDDQFAMGGVGQAPTPGGNMGSFVPMGAAGGLFPPSRSSQMFHPWAMETG